MPPVSLACARNASRRIVHLAARPGRPALRPPRCTPRSTWLGRSPAQAACGLEPSPDSSRSSSSVYGDRADAPFRETDRSTTVSPYAATKKPASLAPRFTTSRLPVTGLRFFTAFGPRNRPDLASTSSPAHRARSARTDVRRRQHRRDYTLSTTCRGCRASYRPAARPHLYNLGHSERFSAGDDRPW